MAKNSLVLILVALVLGANFVFEANGQTGKRRAKPRRATRQIGRAQKVVPASGEAEIISLGADEFGNENNGTRNTGVNPNPNTNDAAAKSTRPTRQTNQNAVNNQTDKDDAGLKDLERLTAAEERAEALRRQLADSMDKESGLKSKLDELDFQLRPENIQRETAVIGSLRPEEVRESRRRLLENEKTRVNEQINRLLDSRAKLETAIASFDALIGKLRARVEAGADTNKNSNPVGTPGVETTTRPDNPPQ